ncbi:MAG: alpha/beta hydrolase [Sphingobacteriales bacterium]|nr:alpha/beta hydrolase [Sphingobacteriales bacterium]
MKKKYLLIFFIILSTGSYSCKKNQTQQNDDPGQPIASNIVYKRVNGTDSSLLMLDIYGKANYSQAPVVIFIHGGTWTSGDKTNVKNGSQFVDFFTRNNAILVSANIRLMHNSLSPNTSFSDQASDVASVVRWVYDNIAAYGGNKSKICLFGFSSGSHLVALVSADERYLVQTGLNLDAVKTTMCFDVNAYDIPISIAEGGSYNYPAAATNLPNYFTSDSTVQIAASPMRYISALKPHPKFLIAYTGIKSAAGDIQTLSKRQSELFAAALNNAGVYAGVNGDLNISHTQLAVNFGLPAFFMTSAAQGFLDQYFW